MIYVLIAVGVIAVVYGIAALIVKLAKAAADFFV